MTTAPVEDIAALVEGDDPKSIDDSMGYLFDNPDAGVEWSQNHPRNSGEVPDAKNIRMATAGELLPLLIEAWAANSALQAMAVQRENDPVRDGWPAEREAHLQAVIADCKKELALSQAEGRTAPVEDIAALVARIIEPEAWDWLPRWDRPSEWQRKVLAEARAPSLEKANAILTALSQAEGRGGAEVDYQRFGRLPVPVSHPDQAWCDAYAAWYYQEPA